MMEDGRVKMDVIVTYIANVLSKKIANPFAEGDRLLPFVTYERNIFLDHSAGFQCFASITFRNYARSHKWERIIVEREL